MIGKSLTILSTAILVTFCSIADAQAPAQWNYSFEQGTAQASYPGKVAVPALGTLDCIGADSGVLVAGTCGGGGGGDIPLEATKADIAGLTATSGAAAYLTLTNEQGMFVYDADNLSTEVTNDPNEGVNIPPTSDPTGASGAWVRQFDGGLSQYWFGAVGDGTADDTAAIQAVFNYSAFSKLPMLFRPGTHLITSPVIDAGNGDMSAATFDADGSSSNFTAYPNSVLVIGDTTSGGEALNVSVTLPQLVNTTHVQGSGWSGQTAIGVSLINLDYSDIVETSIYGFLNGLKIGGFGHGTAYNTIILGNLTSNANELVFLAFDAVGWANQNTVIGGKLSNDTNETNTTGTHGIEFISFGAGDPAPDGNTILGSSVEGPVAIAAEFATAIDNVLNGVRFELPSASLIFVTGTNNVGNMIVGGYKRNISFNNAAGSNPGITMFDETGNYITQPMILGTPGVATNPEILTGTGVPSTSLGTIGSLYLNLSGGSTTTLYVKTGASTWTAK